MQLEVLSWLSHGLSQSSTLCDSKICREIISGSEISKCPKHVLADYSSNVAFVIQKGRSECVENILPIEVLATEIIQELSRLKQDYFQFSVSEFGHINVSLSALVKAKFLQKLAECSAENFFSAQNLLFPEITAVNLQGGAFVVEIEKLLREMDSSKDSEFEKFRSKLSSAPTRDDKWMLLAAASDCELDLRTYLQGLAGKQNIPWYFSRFKSDALRFIKKAKKTLGKNCFEQTELHLPLCASLGLEQVLNYRGTYFNCLKTGRPEVFFSFLLNCMHAFYQFYNRPEVRSFALPTEALAQLRALSKSLCLVVEQGLSKFEFE